MAQAGNFLGVSRSQPELNGGNITNLTSFGVASGGTVGFYGTTPIVQRSGAAQATSAVGTASSADVTTAVKAALIEIMDTLTALGLWKGSA
jgi:hypothetical protein